MDVSCPQCDTLYELDDQQVRRASLTLKCSQCDHLFRLKTGSGARDESDRRWMVRRIDADDVLYFTGFDTLHQWIMDGKIGEQDEISRTGRSWKKLAEVGEFSPIFQVVASIADLSGKNQSDSNSQRERKETSRPKARTNTEPSFRPAPSTGDSAPQAHPSPPGSGPSQSPLPRDSSRKVAPTPIKRPGPSESSAPAATPKELESGTGSARREREGTDEQFKGTSPPPKRDSDAGRGSGDSSSRRRRPTPPPRHRASSQTSPVAEKTPERDVQLQDDRFDTGPQDIQPEVDSEPTLGQLEYGGDDSEVIAEAEFRRRRWPLVVVVVVLVIAGVGVWQYENLEEMLAADGADIDDAVAEPVDSGIDAALAEVDEVLTRAVRAAGDADRAKRVAEASGEATAVLIPAVETAGEAAAAAAPRRPSGPAGFISAGRRALDRGDATQAKERFRQALDEAPTNTDAIVGLGWAKLSAGDLDRAVGRFEEAMQRDSGMGEALIGIGRAERNRGDPAAALSAYEEYLSNFPDGQHASIAQYQSEQLRRQVEQ